MIESIIKKINLVLIILIFFYILFCSFYNKYQEKDSSYKTSNKKILIKKPFNSPKFENQIQKTNHTYCFSKVKKIKNKWTLNLYWIFNYNHNKTKQKINYDYRISFYFNNLKEIHFYKNNLIKCHLDKCQTTFTIKLDKTKKEILKNNQLKYIILKNKQKSEKYFVKNPDVISSQIKSLTQ